MIVEAGLHDGEREISVAITVSSDLHGCSLIQKIRAVMLRDRREHNPLVVSNVGAADRNFIITTINLTRTDARR